MFVEPNAKQNFDITLKGEIVAACDDTFKFRVCGVTIDMLLSFIVFA